MNLIRGRTRQKLKGTIRSLKNQYDKGVLESDGIAKLNELERRLGMKAIVELPTPSLKKENELDAFIDSIEYLYQHEIDEIVLGSKKSLIKFKTK